MCEAIKHKIYKAAPENFSIVERDKSNSFLVQGRTFGGDGAKKVPVYISDGYPINTNNGYRYTVKQEIKIINSMKDGSMSRKHKIL